MPLTHAQSVRPLANAFVTVYESPNPKDVFCYSPGIVRLDSGRLIATIDLGGPGAEHLPGAKFLRAAGFGRYWQGKAFASDDGGKTWLHRTDFAGMVIDGDDLCVLSRGGDERARNAHDGNLITFHRVHAFRKLVYTFQQKEP